MTCRGIKFSAISNFLFLSFAFSVTFFLQPFIFFSNGIILLSPSLLFSFVLFSFATDNFGCSFLWWGESFMSFSAYWFRIWKKMKDLRNWWKKLPLTICKNEGCSIKKKRYKKGNNTGKIATSRNGSAHSLIMFHSQFLLFCLLFLIFHLRKLHSNF